VDKVKLTPQDLWAQVMEILQKELSEVSIDRWFRHLSPSQIQDQTLVVDVPDDFFKNWIVDHYSDHLTVALKTIGTSVALIEFKASSQKIESSSQPVFYGEASPLRPRRPSALNPRYTFEQFVVGPSNRFAHAASLAVTEQPAKAYNPLFIYGPVGLGKTHLMQAIGHEITQRMPDVNVLYITSERFTNELINSIQNRTTLKFREKYRNVDVLLIDDIHFIGGKEATQEEFFHTFNTLYDNHKQIVVSSDRSPKEINKLEERLVSRFEWGLVTDIQPADFETRAAILKKKAERDKITVPDDVTLFIAENVQSNIRELEGALVRVVAYSHLIGQPISKDLAHEALRIFIQESEKKISVEMIQKRVAEHFSVKKSDLTARKRTKNVILPRQIAMFLSRELTPFSLPEIGHNFGGRDHTTILHAYEKIKKAVDKDVDVRETVVLLRRSIES
jgi:chromosomal replication initiator protein